jgi:hypothetical protein
MSGSLWTGSSLIVVYWNLACSFANVVFYKILAQDIVANQNCLFQFGEEILQF